MDSFRHAQVSVGGRLELHGELFSSTWTRLAASVQAGATRLGLRAAANWRSGQLVLVRAPLTLTGLCHVDVGSVPAVPHRAVVACVVACVVASPLFPCALDMSHHHQSVASLGLDAREKACPCARAPMPAGDHQHVQGRAG